MSRRWLLSCLVSAGLIVAGLAVGTPTAEAVQDDNKLLVSFETFDDCKLVGNFYKGEKGSESPVAILVHKFGSDRSKGGWDTLAKMLQKDLKMAVLTFDLRGHGASTVVKDKFWNRNENKFGLRGGLNTKNKSTITIADFKNNYWPMLYNDLVAARRYVDDQNDAQLCNSSTVVVIGAEEGASLGMGWVVQEWDRRVYSGGTGILAVPTASRQAGEDIAAGVWLGATAGTKMRFRIPEWFGLPASSKMRESTPMYFVYGKQDSTSSGVSPNYLSAIKRNPDGRSGKNHNLDKEEGLATKLTGQDLLGSTALNVNEKIVKYLEAVLAKRGAQPWKKQEPRVAEAFPITKYGYAAIN